MSRVHYAKGLTQLQFLAIFLLSYNFNETCDISQFSFEPLSITNLANIHLGPGCTIPNLNIFLFLALKLGPACTSIKFCAFLPYF